MIGYAAICDHHGYVKRMIRNTALLPAVEGQNIRNLFLEEEKLDDLLSQDLSYGVSIRMKLRTEKEKEVFLTVLSLDSSYLILVYSIQSLEQLPQLVELILAAIHVPEVIGQDPYGTGYYEIQKLNSQLINYQRSLGKSNARLQTLLEEVREAKYTIEELEQDTLTGLLTEKAFYAKAAAVLEQNADKTFDVIAVDIEQFKIVNDVFGTKTGDRLLIDLAICLLDLKTNEWTYITRARADTFFVLLPHTKTLYEEVNKKIVDFFENYPLPMRLQAKMGIYHAGNKELIIARMCDRALMAAESIKGNYNAKYAVFDNAMHDKMLQEQKIINTMVESLNRGDFCVYLQPKVVIETGELIGAEALVRWIHPEFGFIMPSDFIPAFEKNGFIYSLDLYVWKKCCEMLRDWKQKGIRTLPMSVNISRIDFYHESLPGMLIEFIREYDLSPEELHLEITETAYTKDSGQLLAIIERLRREGFIIEMDDFGSGYSSLNTLSELPIDVMKLDLKFLNQAEQNLRRQKVLECAVHLADALQVQVIAEGVETKEQAAFLKNMGCFHAQGYLYGRPMSEETFVTRYLTVPGRD